MNLKDKLLWILTFIWTNIIPLLLVIIFNIGIFFNLYEVQMLPIWLCVTITAVLNAIVIYSFGKLLNKW